MKSRVNREILILNIILLIYPIELFEAVHIGGVLGAFTPFRMVILPLCFIYLLIYKNHFPKNVVEMFSVVLFFIMGIIGTVSSSFTSFFSFIGNILQFLMAYNVVKNNKIGKSTLVVITLWAIMQVPAFISSFISGTFGMELRFKGLFFDPNYLCAFVLASVWAAFFLLREENKKIYRLYYLFVIFSGVLMILLSFSRGGLLAALLTLLLYLLVKNRKLFVVIAVISVPIVSAMMIRSQFLTWSDAAENPIDALIYRVFTMSSDAEQLTSGRSEYLHIFVNNIDQYLLFGTDVFDWNAKFNGGQFVHNGFVELLIQGGVIFGCIFIAQFIWCIIRCYFYQNKYKAIPAVWIAFLGSIIALTFLSYTSKYAWLCMGALFALNDLKVFKKQII